MYVTAQEVVDQLQLPSDAGTLARVESLLPVAQEMIDNYLGYSFEPDDPLNPDDEAAVTFDSMIGATLHTVRPFRSVSKVEYLDPRSNTTREIDPVYYTLWPSNGTRVDADRRRLYYAITLDIVGDEDYLHGVQFERGARKIRVTGVWGTDETPITVKYAMGLLIQQLERNRDPNIKLETGLGRTIEWFEDTQGGSVVSMPIKRMLNTWRGVKI